MTTERLNKVLQTKKKTPREEMKETNNSYTNSKKGLTSLQKVSC